MECVSWRYGVNVACLIFYSGYTWPDCRKEKSSSEGEELSGNVIMYVVLTSILQPFLVLQTKHPPPPPPPLLSLCPSLLLSHTHSPQLFPQSPLPITSESPPLIPEALPLVVEDNNSSCKSFCLLHVDWVTKMCSVSM